LPNGTSPVEGENDDNEVSTKWNGLQQMSISSKEVTSESVDQNKIPPGGG
jgi:hypothetical protein